MLGRTGVFGGLALVQGKQIEVEGRVHVGQVHVVGDSPVLLLIDDDELLAQTAGGLVGNEEQRVLLDGKEDLCDLVVDELVVLIDELDFEVHDEVVHQQVEAAVVDVPLEQPVVVSRGVSSGYF